MMAPDPLRSASTVGGTEDTSLALPSDRTLSSGKQRVLDQVHSIKRTKSRHSKSVSSPTSPSPKTLTTYNEFGTFKFMSTKGNGLVGRSSSSSTMSAAGYSKATSFQKTRSQSARVPSRRNDSFMAALEPQTSVVLPKKPNGLQTSRSDSALNPPLSPAEAHTRSIKGRNTIKMKQSTTSAVNGTLLTNSQTGFPMPTSNQSQTDGWMGTSKATKLEQGSMVNSVHSNREVNLKDAVEMLSHSDENYQQFGASVIQNATFKDEAAKNEVYELNGIPPLVELLEHENVKVNEVAAAALRNLVFKNPRNKVQVDHCGAVAKALKLLKSRSSSSEAKKQATGLLWNLSSDEELKQDLLDTALPGLTDIVVQPYVMDDKDIDIDEQSFCNALGCLRNLSSGGVIARRCMRNCPRLIDSLVMYTESCVRKETPDEMGVENCVCILQNLTFQLAKEKPDAFDHNNSRAVQTEEKNAPVGCFSPRSSKIQNEYPFLKHPADSADTDPSGVKWLCHPRTIDTYLSLLESSPNKITQEACCGALQNLTANSKVNGDVDQILMEKLKTSLPLKALMKSDNKTIRKTAFALLDNMSRSKVKLSMAQQMLPELVDFLLAHTEDHTKLFSDEEAEKLSKILLRLLLSDTEVTKKVLNKAMISKLITLSNQRQETYPKGSTATSVLLFNIWNDKNLHTVAKKTGFSKSLFVNKVSISANEILKSTASNE
ncbi:plakophilin-1 [Kryptolebias marmoratus]|uniref:Plakophilin 1 n=1 Tax=Kryptolebias marmoratus TaxID=37003 RepID=A0A3Q3BNP1_KRYMA|nr:plakophilin-1 [Kryptolebias marmoratus]